MIWKTTCVDRQGGLIVVMHVLKKKNPSLATLLWTSYD